jgi:hypothetical protein
MKTKLMTTVATLALVVPAFAIYLVFKLIGWTGMIASDAVGYFASTLVLAAFCMKEMILLRVVAVCSNIAFLIYGLTLGLAPVWLLHAVLLPINCWRLWEGLSPPRLGRSQPHPSSFVVFAERLFRRRDGS